MIAAFPFSLKILAPFKLMLLGYMILESVITLTIHKFTT